jgi:hypothetical protein
VALLIGAFSVALVNSAKHTQHGLPLTTKIFGLVYALIGFGTILYAWRTFETRRRRITERYPGHFGKVYRVLQVLKTHSFNKMSYMDRPSLQASSL